MRIASLRHELADVGIAAAAGPENGAAGAARLVAAIRPDGAAELRDTVTGPLAVSVATLARAETHAALDALLALPRLRLDPARPAAPRGLIFRKPPALHVTWDPDRRLGTSTVGPARSL